MKWKKAHAAATGAETLHRLRSLLQSSGAMLHRQDIATIFVGAVFSDALISGKEIESNREVLAGLVTSKNELTAIHLRRHLVCVFGWLCAVRFPSLGKRFSAVLKALWDHGLACKVALKTWATPALPRALQDELAVRMGVGFSDCDGDSDEENGVMKGAGGNGGSSAVSVAAAAAAAAAAGSSGAAGSAAAGSGVDAASGVSSFPSDSELAINALHAFIYARGSHMMEVGSIIDFYQVRAVISALPVDIYLPVLPALKVAAVLCLPLLASGTTKLQNYRAEGWRFKASETASGKDVVPKID